MVGSWFRKHSLDVCNLMPACLMWIVQKEWNSRMFEDVERSLDQLKPLLIRSLLDLVLGMGFYALYIHFASPKLF